MKKTAVYALTPQGAKLGKILSEQMDGDLFLPDRMAGSCGAAAFDSLLDVVSEYFSNYAGHVFIAAAGIVVRAIAPHLQSKVHDPAVVVLDHEGRYCISLLSGHLGGANELAVEVARITGGEAVITTATDTAGLPSMDLLAKDKDLVIANLNAVKRVNMAILSGGKVRIFDPEDRLGLESQQCSLIDVSRNVRRRPHGFTPEQLRTKHSIQERSWITPPRIPPPLPLHPPRKPRRRGAP